jgi:lipoprotein-anchoring transpeptidase ErfK/SrfK
MKKVIATVLTLLFTTQLFAYKEIVVDLSLQMAYAMEDGIVVFDGRISSGKRGRETPAGDYRIIQKKRHHKSNLWPKPNGGAKMPYMMRLTNSGIAMHLGYVPNKPASHGCIRLEPGFAQKMYKWARVGTYVYVEGDAQDFMYGSDEGYADRYYDDFDSVYYIDN